LRFPATIASGMFRRVVGQCANRSLPWFMAGRRLSRTAGDLQQHFDAKSLKRSDFCGRFRPNV